MTGGPPKEEPDTGGEPDSGGAADREDVSGSPGVSVTGGEHLRDDDAAVQEADEESFPASDAPSSWSGPPES